MRSACLAVFLALLAVGAIAAESSIAVPDLHAIGLVVAADDALWFTGALNVIGRVSREGSVQQATIPWPFGNESRAAMLALPDGSVIIGSYNGRIALVDKNLRATVYTRPKVQWPYDGLVSDLALDRHGNVRFLDELLPIIGTLAPDGAITEVLLPRRAFELITDADGEVYLATEDGVFRLRDDGSLESEPLCMRCLDWWEVSRDGIVWSSTGSLEPGEQYVAHQFAANDATRAADGTFWLAGWSNLVRRVDAQGTVQEFPLRNATDRPHAITAWRGAIWYGVHGALQSIDPNTVVDLRLRYGDLVTHEEEPNCCFEGTHPVLAFHRRGDAGFVRRVEEEGYSFSLGSVYVWDAGTLVAERHGASPATVHDLEGTLQRALPAVLHENESAFGMVLDAAGGIHTLRGGFETGYHVVSLGTGGNVIRTTRLAVPTNTWIRGVDLAADQCTLYFAATTYRANAAPVGEIGRADVCRGTSLTPFQQAMDGALFGLRLLPGGQVLASSEAKTTLFDAVGNAVREFPAEDDYWDRYPMVALDVDQLSFWWGSWSGLRRIDIATGEVVERRSVYGYPLSMSVVGEPRAARVPVRRRAVRH